MLKKAELDDISGRTAIITGGCKGIGSCISISLLKYGCKVIMTGRDKSASDEIMKFVANTSSLDRNSIEFVEMDLDNIDSIRNGVEVISKKYKVVDFLINNAGIGVNSPKEKGVNSLSKYFNGDSVYSTNVMGHYILTELLLPIMSKDARVINMSSIVHFLYKPHYDNKSNISYIYANSKLANIHHAIILQRRFNDMNCNRLAFSCAPGFIPTKLFSDMRERVNPNTAKFKCGLIKLFGKTPYQGAQVVLFLCKTPKKHLYGGSYYNNNKIGITSKYAIDTKLQQNFYKEIHNLYQKLISVDNSLTNE